MKKSGKHVETIKDFLSKSSYLDRENYIVNWWHNFICFSDEISKTFSSIYVGELDLPIWMKENLQTIDKNLMWEFYSGINKKHRLVITSEEVRNLRPLVKKILNSVPELDNWEFYAYRLPEDLKEIPSIMEERVGWRDIDDIRFQLSINMLNRIDIVYCLPISEKSKDRLEDLFLLTILILGEERVDKWLGGIDVKFADGERGESIFGEQVSYLGSRFVQE